MRLKLAIVAPNTCTSRCCYLKNDEKRMFFRISLQILSVFPKMVDSHRMLGYGMRCALVALSLGGAEAAGRDSNLANVSDGGLGTHSLSIYWSL